jgi:hypothetical protein
MYIMKKYNLILLLFCAGWVQTGCVKNYLPSDRDAFSLDMNFTQQNYRPILGRNTLFQGVFSDINSTKPLTFQIVNVRTFDGKEAPELLKLFPVKVWKQAYTGAETSVAEIESKREIQNRPLFEIREHSGDFLMWQSASSLILKPAPDSGYLFDVYVSNSGGSKVFKDFRLMPYRERESEPNNADLVTGNASSDVLHPMLMTNMIGDSSNVNLSTNDVDITMFKRSTNANTLTIRFLDPQNNPIDPARFDLTDWANLVHGFNMQKTATYVKYDVAYPIPLAQQVTKYTNISGNAARLYFAYDRLGSGGYRIVSEMMFDFQIYAPGEWEIVISFTEEAPKFIDA